MTLPITGWLYYIFIGYPITYLMIVLTNKLMFETFNIYFSIKKHFKITNESYIANLLPIPGNLLVKTFYLNKYGIKKKTGALRVVEFNFINFLLSTLIYLSLTSQQYIILFFLLIILLTKFRYSFLVTMKLIFISSINLVNFSLSYYFLSTSLSLNESGIIAVSSIFSSFLPFAPNGIGVRELIIYLTGELYGFNALKIVFATLIMRGIGILYQLVIYSYFKINTRKKNKSKKKYIVLTGTFSSLNKGDAALQRTAIEEINTKFPKYSIKLLSNFPSIDKTEYQDLNVEIVKTYRRVLPIYFLAVFIYKITFKKVSLLPEFKIIENAQKVVDLSGDTFSDHFGKLVPFSKALTLYIAMLNNVEYYFCSQSMGPFNKQFNFVKKIIKNGEKIFLRETESVKYLDRLTKNYDVFTDIAFNLPTDKEFGVQYVKNNISSHYESNFLIGINISYRFINSNKKTVFLDLNNLSNELSKTIDRNIIFVGIPHSFGPKKSQNDLYAIKELYKNLNNMTFYIIDNSSINSVQMKGIISCLDFVISARMHLSIASISSHVPSFSLANSHKYVGVLKEFLKEEEIFNAGNLGNKKLISQVTEAIVNREGQINTIKKNLPSVIEMSKLNIESIFKK